MARCKMSEEQKAEVKKAKAEAKIKLKAIEAYEAVIKGEKLIDSSKLNEVSKKLKSIEDLVNEIKDLI